MKTLPFAVTLVLATVLAACQPIEEEVDEDDLDPQLQGCLPIEGEVDVTEADPVACEGCEILLPENAVDGNPASFATIRMPVDEGGTAKIRVTNESAFIAGRLFGVLHSIEYGKSASPSITLGTLNGTTATADQETLNLGSIVSGDENSPTRFSYESTTGFDGVEISFSRTDGTTSSGTVTARIHEFCSNAPPVD